MTTINAPKRPLWRRCLGWVKRHPWLTIIFTLIAGFVFLNGLAYVHASAMLNYSNGLVRTRRPEQLSLGEKIKVLLCGVSLPRPVNSGSPTDIGCPFEVIHHSTDDGYKLEAWHIAASKSLGTVIMFHGYAGSRSALLKQAKEIYSQGWTVILVDFRGSGGSDGNATSLGIKEANDVVAMVGYARERGLPGPLILYGQSMGAAAILRSVAKYDVKPDAIILESVFNRMVTTVRNRFAVMGCHPSRQPNY
ncbi:MAG: alpha/beta fold hydrolase [Pirellulales bacterium]